MKALFYKKKAFYKLNSPTPKTRDSRAFNRLDDRRRINSFSPVATCRTSDRSNLLLNNYLPRVHEMVRLISIFHIPKTSFHQTKQLLIQADTKHNADEVLQNFGLRKRQTARQCKAKDNSVGSFNVSSVNKTSDMSTMDSQRYQQE